MGGSGNHDRVQGQDRVGVSRYGDGLPCGNDKAALYLYLAALICGDALATAWLLDLFMVHTLVARILS